MLSNLPETYVDHVVAPRGLGDVCDANATGEVGSMVGGLGVRVSLCYEATASNGARIKSACGRAFGASASIGPLSWLLEAVCGMSWDEACAITPQHVLHALADGAAHGSPSDGSAPGSRSNGTSALPESVTRGAEFAVRALRRALGVAAHGTPADPNGDGLLVCRCIGVGDRRIRRAIEEGAADPESIGRACGAGTGCGSCRPDLLTLLDEARGDPAPLPDPALPAIARIAFARAGPLLRAYGLPLVEARLEGETLVIRTGEAAPGALLTVRSAPAVVRQVLREIVGADVAVVHESQGNGASGPA